MKFMENLIEMFFIGHINATRIKIPHDSSLKMLDWFGNSLPHF